MFNINEGDTLMFMGDINRGMVLVKDTEFYKIMEDKFQNDKN